MRLIDADVMREKIRVVVQGAESLALKHELQKWVDDQPTVFGWISVHERMPETGKHVLVVCEIKSVYVGEMRYVCEAFYAAKHALPEGKYPEDDECYDYDEEEDEYYLREGWYECIHNWGEYSSVVIDDTVTHWMPLPEPPEEVKADD